MMEMCAIKLSKLDSRCRWLPGRRWRAKVCAASVELWHDGACVARHERCLRSGAQSLRARAGGTFCGAGELGRLRTEYRPDEREGVSEAPGHGAIVAGVAVGQ